ncbi:MAG: alkyl hydroperoxide reductase subunit F, partial [Shewanella sp.]|nr:alkyl hydroperoxide reductase subunit F [Shewanella sp.]
MLDANLKNQLQTYLQNLKRPVELVVSADESRKSQELKSLAQDIVSLSSLVSLKEVQGERTPAMTVINPELNTQISFAGLPMGHEFTSLVLALLHTGGHPIKLSDDIIKQIRNLPGKYAFETYVSLTCQNCPDVVQALNMMAAINPNITNV